jgi:hypothetical protein
MVNNCFDTNLVGVATVGVYNSFVASGNYANNTAGGRCPLGADFADPTRFALFSPDCTSFDADVCGISSTFAPIGVPTGSPSDSPSTVPTFPVTENPSADTPAPSTGPSEVPTTLVPTGTPSQEPTLRPSINIKTEGEQDEIEKSAPTPTASSAEIGVSMTILYGLLTATLAVLTL